MADTLGQLFDFWISWVPEDDNVRFFCYERYMLDNVSILIWNCILHIPMRLMKRCSITLVSWLTYQLHCLVDQILPHFSHLYIHPQTPLSLSLSLSAELPTSSAFPNSPAKYSLHIGLQRPFRRVPTPKQPPWRHVLSFVPVLPAPIPAPDPFSSQHPNTVPALRPALPRPWPNYHERKHTMNMKQISIFPTAPVGVGIVFPRSLAHPYLHVIKFPSWTSTFHSSAKGISALFSTQPFSLCFSRLPTLDCSITV